jgi:hypothetical protein
MTGTFLAVLTNLYEQAYIINANVYLLIIYFLLVLSLLANDIGSVESQEVVIFINCLSV